MSSLAILRHLHEKKRKIAKRKQLKIILLLEEINPRDYEHFNLFKLFSTVDGNNDTVLWRLFSFHCAHQCFFNFIHIYTLRGEFIQFVVKQKC